MPVSRPAPRAAALPALLFTIVSAPVLAQAPAGPPAQFSGETVNVEIQIVPFYAVDSEGRPVYDLRPEEVELRVGGTPVPIETFDRYGMAAGGRPGSRKGSPDQKASTEPAPSRQVFFLFDLAFSNETGLNLSQRLAAELLDDWPATDRLTLLVNDTQTGFAPRLGPLPAAGEGKARMLEAIKALKPEVRRLNQNTEADFPAASGVGRSGGLTQMEHNYDAMRASARGEYHGIASAFAHSLEVLALNLRRTPGPKLLVVFSQGLDSNLYFNGDDGNRVGSDETILVDSRRAPPLMDRFKGPLAALADSGVLTLFVNGGKKGFESDSALRDMAKTTGGLYFEGVSAKSLEGRIAGSTAAYYEAGFLPTGALLQAARAHVEVAVRRPGVRAWAPAAVRTREAYASLSSEEKRLLVLSVVTEGPGAHMSRVPVRLDFQELEGKMVKEGTTLVRFEADWPADLTSRPIDLYTVTFMPPDKDKRGRILRYDPHEGVAASEHAVLEAPLEGQDFVWGIVAVDPQTERTWVRRLMVKPGS